MDDDCARCICSIWYCEDDSKIEEINASDKTAEECEIPAFAKAIGHEDLWLKHNGCPPRGTKQKDDEK